MSTLSMIFSLFLLMDPIGNIPFFISALKGIPPHKHFKIIIRELLIALVIMIFFNYLGGYLLNALNINPYSVLVSGGIILFMISLKMIFPSQSDLSDPTKPDKEPFIVPLAVPLIAGPAVLAAIILYSRQDEIYSVLAITCAWVISTLILLTSPFLNRLLGERGIIACERLMGLVLTMMSIQMLLEGVQQFVHALRITNSF